MLDQSELGAYLRHATRSLFRLETLPVYDVPNDRGDYLGTSPGSSPRTWSGRVAGWTSLREQRAQGLDRRRVRVLRTPLSDYDRYACEWGTSTTCRPGTPGSWTSPSGRYQPLWSSPTSGWSTTSIRYGCITTTSAGSSAPLWSTRSS